MNCLGPPVVWLGVMCCWLCVGCLFESRNLDDEAGV